MPDAVRDGVNEDANRNEKPDQHGPHKRDTENATRHHQHSSVGVPNDRHGKEQMDDETHLLMYPCIAYRTLHPALTSSGFWCIHHDQQV